MIGILNTFKAYKLSIKKAQVTNIQLKKEEIVHLKTFFYSNRKEKVEERKGH